MNTFIFDGDFSLAEILIQKRAVTKKGIDYRWILIASCYTELMKALEKKLEPKKQHLHKYNLIFVHRL